jgi:Flp pilus assembly pilin Flp
MLKFCVILKHLLSNEEGQDLIEYVLIVSLLSLACISGVSGFGVMVAALCDTLVKAAAQILG